MIDERQVYERLLAAGAPVTWEAERGWCRWAATECIVVGHPEDDTYEAIDLWGDRLAYVTDTDDVVRVVCAHLGLTEPAAETTTGEAPQPLDHVAGVAETVADSPDEATHCACPVCGEDTHDGRVCDPCAHQAVVDERDTLRQQLRDLQEAHELAIAELSRPLAEREAELRAAFGTDDVDGVLSDRDDAIRRADAAEARLRLVGDAVAALVEVARG
jgi:hypothetical protein